MEKQPNYAVNVERQAGPWLKCHFFYSPGYSKRLTSQSWLGDMEGAKHSFFALPNPFILSCDE